jgi:glycosyltransferase involved in cell wall biosynthesis
MSMPREIRQGSNLPSALLLMAHEPSLDPRIDWMSEGLARDFHVCELGTYRIVSKQPPSREQLSSRRTRVRIERQRNDWDWVPTGRFIDSKKSVGLQTLMMLYMFAELPSRSLERIMDSAVGLEADLDRFRWFCRYFVHANGGLLQAARLIGQFDVIIATDLPTLPAALVLGQECDAPVLYDAHEYWPYSLDFKDWEVQFWQQLEQALAPLANIRVTVSPNLAEHMSKVYSCNFLAVPNCAPIGSETVVDLESALKSLSNREEVFFLFLGSFAPGRGLEDLVTAWDRVDSRAKLVLRGPDNPFKTKIVELAQSRGLLDRSISFPAPVTEGELIHAAREADVGIIPYSPHNIAYRYSCPNKLSQYMAAGLPIICNEIAYVSSVVEDNDIGTAVNFSDHEALASVINSFVYSKQQIVEMSHRSREIFRTSFNWESVSQNMYNQVCHAVRKRPHTRPEPDFSWIERGIDMCHSAEELGSAAAMFPQSNFALVAEIDRLNKVYPADYERLNKEYERRGAEIERLNKVYSAEHERLNEEYERRGAEIERLTKEIARLGEDTISQITWRRLLAGSLRRARRDLLS